MTEKPNFIGPVEKPKFVESIEAKTAIVEKWLENIGEKQKVGEISTVMLREVLTHFGADFENLTEEDRKSLRGYTEKEKGPIVRKVWGDEFVNDFKEWTKIFIENYESDSNHRRLPELKPSGRKNSGMIQFLFELTAFSIGEIDQKTYREYTEARVVNGKLWSENRGDERIRLETPAGEKPMLVSSIPPEFVNQAWSWIKNRKTV